MSNTAKAGYTRELAELSPGAQAVVDRYPIQPASHRFGATMHLMQRDLILYHLPRMRPREVIRARHTLAWLDAELRARRAQLIDDMPFKNPYRKSLAAATVEWLDAHLNGTMPK